MVLMDPTKSFRITVLTWGSVTSLGTGSVVVEVRGSLGLPGTRHWCAYVGLLHVDGSWSGRPLWVRVPGTSGTAYHPSSPLGPFWTTGGGTGPSTTTTHSTLKDDETLFRSFIFLCVKFSVS